MGKNDNGVTMDEHHLSSLLVENTPLRLVEPGIYSVAADNESGNEYDTRFGVFYSLQRHPFAHAFPEGFLAHVVDNCAGRTFGCNNDGTIL